MMRILLIAYNFPPEPGSASIKMYEMAEYFSKRGHKVTVITTFPNYPYGLVYKKYRKKIFMIEYDKKAAFKIIRVPAVILPYSRRPIFRTLGYTSFIVSATVGGILAGKHDLIYVYSPPPQAGFAASIIGLITRTPFIIWVNDLWPDAPIYLGIIKHPILKKLAYLLEKIIYAKALKIATYSFNTARLISKKGVPPSKLDYHPLWVDTNILSPKPKDYSIANKYGIPINKFIVMYAGNIGIPQGLEVLIECANILQNEYKVKDIVFVIIGEGERKRYLLKLAKKYNLKNVFFIPSQPFTKIPFFLAIADVLFVHLKPAPHRIGTIPEKLYAYMSCGKPVIVAISGEAADIVERAKCGISVPPEDPLLLANAILELYSRRESLNEIGQRAREYILKNHDKRKVLERLENKLLSILKFK